MTTTIRLYADGNGQSLDARISSDRVTLVSTEVSVRGVATEWVERMVVNLPGDAVRRIAEALGPGDGGQGAPVPAPAEPPPRPPVAVQQSLIPNARP